jgi:hypothetical protein
MNEKQKLADRVNKWANENAGSLSGSTFDLLRECETALRAEAQEPVAWQKWCGLGILDITTDKATAELWRAHADVRPLYAAPQEPARLSAESVGCGTPGCTDPNCDYGKGPLRCQTCGAVVRTETQTASAEPETRFITDGDRAYADGLLEDLRSDGLTREDAAQWFCKARVENARRRCQAEIAK